MSFEEVYAGNRHCVLLVECSGHGLLPTVTPLEISNPSPLVNIPREGAAPWEEVRDEFARYPADIPSYIRLSVEVEGMLPSGANDEAVAIACEKACMFCLINAVRKDNGLQKGRARTFTTAEFKQLDTVDVARMWIECKGDTFDDSMREILEEVKKDVMLNANDEHPL